MTTLLTIECTFFVSAAGAVQCWQLTLFGMTLEVMLKHRGDTFISFKILKEPIPVQKQTVTHLKAPLLGFFETERISQKKFFKHEGDKDSPPPPVPNRVKQLTFLTQGKKCVLTENQQHHSSIKM